MPDNERLKAAVEKMVSEEIAALMATIRPVVEEAVRESLLPQLKAAVRDALVASLESCLSGEAGSGLGGAPGDAPRGGSERPAVTGKPEPGAPVSSGSAAKGPAVGEEATGPRPADPGARYIYGIVASDNTADNPISLGPIGLDGAEVYLITAGDLAAIVHDCPPTPYENEDEDTVKGWVQTHQAVLDAAGEYFDPVLPLGFDVIIAATEAASATTAVVKWLQSTGDDLRPQMEKLKGRQEFGVQILYDPRLLAETAAATDPEVQQLQEEMRQKPPGLAYMYQQKLEKRVKEAVEATLDSYYREFYQAITEHAVDTKVEKVKKLNDQQLMLLNLSCLVERGQEEKLGEVLERINGSAGFQVRFTGPWPAYSFVSAA